MRKIRWEEAALFLVPLAIVPLSQQASQFQKGWIVEDTEINVAPSAPQRASTRRPDILSQAQYSDILPSRDGRLIYTCGSVFGKPGLLHAWDARALKHKRVLAAPSVVYSGSLRLSPDGHALFYRTGDQEGLVLDTRSGKRTARIRGRDLTGLAINNQVMAVSRGQEVELLSLHDGHATQSLSIPQPGFAREISFSSDGSLVAWVNEPERFEDSTAVVYSMPRKRWILKRPLKNLCVRQAALSGGSSKLVVVGYRRELPTGSAAAASSSDVLLVLDLARGRQLYRRDLPGHNGSTLAVSLNGRWAALINQHRPDASPSTQLQIVDLSTGDAVMTQRRDKPSQSTIAFSADSRRLLISGSLGSQGGFKLADSGAWTRV